MKFDKLLIGLMIIVFSINTIHGLDPLSPSQLGESMSVPLHQELVQTAISSGITKSASPVAETPLAASEPIGEAAYNEPSGRELNVSGPLSLILQDKIASYLDLELHQSEASVQGHGRMISGNSLQNVTVSGLAENGKLSMTIAGEKGEELYSVELQPEGNTLKGSYEVQSSDGASRTGTALGILSNDAAMLQPPQEQISPNSAVMSGTTEPSSAATTRARPIQLGQGGLTGSTFSSSKSISMSSGGSMVSSSSSVSF